jgi:hypothetical protein
MMKLNEDSNRSRAEKEQLSVLVERLENFISGYLLQAEKLKVTLSTQHMLDLVDRAILRAQKVEQELDFDKTVEGYFLEGMLEDLVCQQESIYEQVTTPEGESTYVPVSDAVWLECLKHLRIVLIKIVSA